MIQIKKHIPNFITSLNLFSGCVAAVFAFNGDLVSAAWLVLLAAVFDFLDGFAARGLHAYSEIGKELDSLADVVSFGFVPSVVAFMLIKQSLLDMTFLGSEFLPYAAFLIAIFSALRLAIFNLDERQTTSFIGLPTPANGLFWIGLGAWSQQFQGFALSLIWIVILVLFFSFMLISSLPMFSLKMKSASLKDNFIPFSLLFAGVVLVSIFDFLGLSLTIGVYVLISFVVKIYNR